MLRDGVSTLKAVESSVKTTLMRRMMQHCYVITTARLSLKIYIHYIYIYHLYIHIEVYHLYIYTLRYNLKISANNCIHTTLSTVCQLSSLVFRVFSVIMKCICNELGGVKGQDHTNNEQTQSVDGII